MALAKGEFYDDHDKSMEQLGNLAALVHAHYALRLAADRFLAAIRDRDERGEVHYEQTYDNLLDAMGDPLLCVGCGDGLAVGDTNLCANHLACTSVGGS